MGSIDDALAALQDPDRACLQRIIASARAVCPDAVDGVSYGLPALLLQGKPLLGVAAAAHHLALYPFSPAVLDAVAPALEGFPRSKGTVRFTAARPLPDDLVREIVRLRRLEIAGR
jgi:uncharacterized protein YdhG (YjbR/CyaY superfamily)